ncbi:Histone H1 [Triticum urartu]|uniref:Histone H1 n=1 Tax=Triticum urartu TaxID=4572 RepID=M7ZXJ0_TRIUA|nr:Histone H1 [Triticum urartu]
MSTEVAAADIPVPQVEVAADAAVDTPAAKPAKAPKAAKAKKSTGPKKPRVTPAHPSYAEMVSEAIAALKERSGSSTIAIGKFIEDKHKAHLPANFRKILLTQIKKLVAAGKLTKVKGSYKLAKAPAAVKPKTATKKKPAAKPKAKAPAKKTAANNIHWMFVKTTVFHLPNLVPKIIQGYGRREMNGIVRHRQSPSMVMPAVSVGRRHVDMPAFSEMYGGLEAAAQDSQEPIRLGGAGSGSGRDVSGGGARFRFQFFRLATRPACSVSLSARPKPMLVGSKRVDVGTFYMSG